MKKIALYLVVLVGLVVLLGVATTFLGGDTMRPPVHAQTVNCPYTNASVCLSGWAWSSNIGWISFNSSDVGTNSLYNYDVALSTTTGNLTGYAWSSNIGWIKFGGLTGIKNGGTNAKVDLTSGGVTGWVKALSADNNGWDGWIELSDIGADQKHPTRFPDGDKGVTFATTSKQFKGFAWGSTVVGWLFFSPIIGKEVKCVGSCDNNVGGGPALTLTASNGYKVGKNLTGLNAVTAGSLVGLNWTIQGLENCQKLGSAWIDVSNTSTIDNDQTGYGSITFTTPTVNSSGVSLPGMSPYVLTITCDVPSASLGETRTDQVSIDVVEMTSGQPLCSVPSHAELCDPSNAGQPGIATFAPNNICESPAPFCQVKCSTGWKLQGSACVRSSIEEI